MDKLIKNDNGILNIDLMFALSLLIGIVLVSIYTVPKISTEDRDWRMKQYMAAVRITDGMIQNGGDLGWEINWTNGNYSDVKKIGFLYIDNNSKPLNKVLDLNKIEALMGNGYRDNLTNTTWWEFPLSDNLSIIDNASRGLGLTDYNFYIQLHPVGLKLSDSASIESNLSNKSINFETASVVDRYVYVADRSIPDNIKYLKFDNEAIHYRLSLWIW